MCTQFNRKKEKRFWGLLCFICLKFNPQYWYLLLLREKMCWFSSYFNIGSEENFAVPLQNRKICVCIKFLTLVRLRKLIAVNFTFFTRCKMHITPALLKNYSFHNFLNKFKLCLCLFFSKKNFFTSKNVMLMFTSWHLLEHLHLTCSRICW